MPLLRLVRPGQASAAGRELARRGLRDPYPVAGTLARRGDTVRVAAEAAGFRGPLHQDARWNGCDHIALLGRCAPPDDRERPVQDLLDRALTAWMRDPDPTGAERGPCWRRVPAPRSPSCPPRSAADATPSCSPRPA